MLKILHVAPYFHPAYVYGGPIETAYQLCKHSIDRGAEIRALTTDANGGSQTLEVDSKQDIEIANKFFVRYCNRWRGTTSPSLFKHLPEYIRWADIVHLTMIYSSPTPPTLLLSKLIGRPVVWSPHGSRLQFPGRSKPSLKKIWNYVCQRVAPEKLLIQVASRVEEKDTSLAFPNHDIVLIPNGVTIPDIPQLFPRNRKLRLLYLGRLHPKKGISQLLAACEILTQSSLQFDLVIAGEGDRGYTKELENEILIRKLSDHVEMAGLVTGEEKWALMGKSDVLVLPSFFESFGNVVAEALAFGVPVIASRHTPWSRLEEMNCGLWIDNTPDSLAQGIRDIDNMPLREMGKRGRNWMKNEFAWPKVADNIMKHYSQLMS